MGNKELKAKYETILEVLLDELRFARNEFKRVHKEYLKNQKKEGKYSFISGVNSGQRMVNRSRALGLCIRIRTYRNELEKLNKNKLQ